MSLCTGMSVSNPKFPKLIFEMAGNFVDSSPRVAMVMYICFGKPVASD